MVKHNNVVPNGHFHKKYCQSSRGPLKVRLTLNQASRKKVRRLKRAERAAKIAPRPLQQLRPIVHCQTQRYSAKVRLGRGFTLEELKAVKLNAKYARTIGIAVDTRRTNKSEESMQVNVARLEEYKKNLVLVPKKSAETYTQASGTIQPIVKVEEKIVCEAVTDELKSFKAYTTMRLARQETRVEGFRAAVKNRKKKD